MLYHFTGIFQLDPQHKTATTCYDMNIQIISLEYRNVEMALLQSLRQKCQVQATPIIIIIGEILVVELHRPLHDICYCKIFTNPNSNCTH